MYKLASLRPAFFDMIDGRNPSSVLEARMNLYLDYGELLGLVAHRHLVTCGEIDRVSFVLKFAHIHGLTDMIVLVATCAGLLLGLSQEALNAIHDGLKCEVLDYALQSI